jgi:hypothetical protein
MKRRRITMFTVDDVKNSLIEVAAADPYRIVVACTYSHSDRTPNCIVGQVLDKLAPEKLVEISEKVEFPAYNYCDKDKFVGDVALESFGVLALSDNLPNYLWDRYVGVDTFSEDALVLLNSAQRLQDVRSVGWQEVVDRLVNGIPFKDKSFFEERSLERQLKGTPYAKVQV